MSNQFPFRVSTHLKDIIGRELVTNEFVAIFELVKNSFDARANHVYIEIDPESNQIAIADDGKGMSLKDIKEKWLFVAYSAKADGTEDKEISKDYRDKFQSSRSYAGNKGIGRFACDTLGARLQLFSRTNNNKEKGLVNLLEVDWSKFEHDSSKEFSSIDVNLDTSSKFPPLQENCVGEGSGTILLIHELRHKWDDANIRKLRQYLAKLIDPFGTTDSAVVSSSFAGSDISDTSLNGPIKNKITDILEEKTAKIKVDVTRDHIVTTLVDRGKLIYKISESNTYDGLKSVELEGNIYYLNRSAKATFSRRMSIQPVRFGSIFLFLNKFRIFPIGEEVDDTFGLNRRKQQGQSRMLGTRDVLGRIDITDPSRIFREATSRDAGLIEDAHTRQLIEAVRKHMIFRLERYVVGVNWPDKADQDRETPDGLTLDPAKTRILSLIGSIARTQDIDILSFDEDIVDLVDSRQEASNQALQDLSAIAGREGNAKLMQRIEDTRRRIVELEESEKAAQKLAEDMALEREATDAKIGKLIKRTRYLSQSQNLDAERVQLLLHQVSIYSNHIKDGINRVLDTARDSLKRMSELDSDDPAHVAGVFRHHLREMMDDMSYIHLENKRLLSVSRFSPNIHIDMSTNKIKGDIVGFLDEYFSIIMPNHGKGVQTMFFGEGIIFNCTFSPFDMAVVIDNIIDNARVHEAQVVQFNAKMNKNETNLEILVSDDGLGFDPSRMDPGMIFEKHYSTKIDGTGLGLYHVRQVLKEMNGKIEINPKAPKNRADFVITLTGDQS